MTTTTTSTVAANAAAATTQGVNNSASQQIAGNFDQFLQLLTTQLQNQDPTSPMDPNSFTQELVEFASVEQQINTNTNMQTLISLQQATTDLAALQLMGQTVTISGNGAVLSNATNSPATWTLNSPSAATANVAITNSSGQTVFNGTTSLNAGTQTYSWNGRGNNGVTWPDGNYTISVTATGANGQPVSVSTQVQGVVSAVNTSANPPTLTVGGQTVPMSSVQSIGGAGSNGGLASSLSTLNSNIGSLTNTIKSLSQLL